MTDTVYIITKYYFYEAEWIVYVSEDYEKADKCFSEHKKKLKKQQGVQLSEYQYDVKIDDCEKGHRTIKHIINDGDSLQEWTEDGWIPLVKSSTPWRELM